MAELSFVDLQILKKKYKFNNKFNEYFINKYFQPDVHLTLAKKLFRFANSSIDISDGLITDLEKMMNSQNYSYQIFARKIPISKNLLKLIDIYKFNRSDFVSNGDDYQVLFTASTNKSRIIEKIAKIHRIKITKIGKIISNSKKDSIIDQKGREIRLKNKGYIHKF